MPAARDAVEGRWHLRRTITMSIALKNHVITIITIYPSNFENIFISSLQLQYMPTCLRGNHLAKNHRSRSQGSTRIKAQ